MIESSLSYLIALLAVRLIMAGAGSARRWIKRIRVSITIDPE